jgi:hypothetical protein
VLKHEVQFEKTIRIRACLQACRPGAASETRL